METAARIARDDMPGMIDATHRRSQEQWWLDLRPIARLLSQFGVVENQSAK
jgi:hypothetical protein